MQHKKKWLILGLCLFGLAGIVGNSKTDNLQAKSYHKAVTKIAGKKTYPIYRRMSANGPSEKIGSTKFLKYGQLQSKKSQATKKGTYWKLIADGREVGWVKQNFFARSKISVAPSVSLIWNNNYSFTTRDALNYATDRQGTAIAPAKVKVSVSSIKSNAAGTTKVTYSYGKAKATSKVTVRSDQHEDASTSFAPAQPGGSEVAAWKGSSKSSSKNWNAAHHYQAETRPNIYRSKGLTLKTSLFEPRFLSLGYNEANDKMGQVGVIPEGITVANNVLVTSLYNSSSSLMGHLVSYNLKKIKSKYALQNLTTMSWSSFKKYAQKIKVSPYIKLGHGQALGSSRKYIYVIANDNHSKDNRQAEEIMQVRKADMQINKIWTFHIAGCYIHNATFSGDNTMYCLYHNGGNGYYEYWKVTRQGDTWTPVQVGKTKTNFVNNGSPVQGFTYDAKRNRFYVGFNDYIFRVAGNGAYQKAYHFKTKRELEGLAASNNKLYVELAQRGELLNGKIK